MSETAGAALRRAATALHAAGIEDAGREARLLIVHSLGLPPGSIPDRDAVVDPARLDRLLRRRAAREPMALILGHQGFWTLDLEVSRDTLIPRPDTEALIEAALAFIPDRRAVRRVLDLGTGTGCLLLAALAEFPDSSGLGIDLSPEAAALANRNARANGLASRAMFACGNWDAPIAGVFDLVLSNPPYIESKAIDGLMPEVRGFEPPRALDGGADGLDAYRAILPRLPHLLGQDGVAVLEVGVGQAESVVALAKKSGLARRALREDLGGIARALVLEAGVARKNRLAG
jgi:release factor glutamine methyltransferase